MCRHRMLCSPLVPWCAKRSLRIGCCTLNRRLNSLAVIYPADAQAADGGWPEAGGAAGSAGHFGCAMLLGPCLLAIAAWHREARPQLLRAV